MTTATAPETTGRSLLDDPVPAPAAPARALLLVLKAGTEFVVRHARDPWALVPEYVWGERFLCFDDGNRVRPEEIARAAEMSPLDAAAIEAAAKAPVLVQQVGTVAAATGDPLDDLPYSVWPLEALLAEEKRMDPEGRNSSDDLTEIRAAIAARRAAP